MVAGGLGAVTSNVSQKAAIKNNENQNATVQAMDQTAMGSNAKYANQVNANPVSVNTGSAPTITGANAAPKLVNAPAPTNAQSALGTVPNLNYPTQ